MDIPQQHSLIPTDTNQHEFTALSQIELEEDQSDLSQEGEMDTTKLSLFNPLYKELQKSTSDPFYMKFFNCLQTLHGSQSCRYSHMHERFSKFFIFKPSLQKGERWSKRLQPNYSNPQTYPLQNAVMIYGVDYLSNRDIRNKFGLGREFGGVKRINWSNVVILFESRQQLEDKLKPVIFDNANRSFFKPKQEDYQHEDEQTSLLTLQQLPNQPRLPRQWYGLRPYEYKDQYIFWFVRYLTSNQPQYLEKIRETNEFMQTYNASKRLWERRQKNRENFYSSGINTSRYQTIYRSRGVRSIKGGSQIQRRQRSRDKCSSERMDIESLDLMKSNVLVDDLRQQQQLSSNNILSQQTPAATDRSHHEQMSFVYIPQMSNLQQMQSQMELKKKSDQLLDMFEMLTVNCKGKTLQNVRNMDINNDQDDDFNGMQVITQTFDPRGSRDCLYVERKSKISRLTELKPQVKFNYSDYVERILEAEQENKDNNRKSIPVICVD